MKKNLAIKVLAILLGCLSSLFSIAAIAAFEFDDMPIDIAEADFVKNRPTARRLGQDKEKNTYSDYLYILPRVKEVFGGNAFTSARSFKLGKGCAIGIGFKLPNKKAASEVINNIKNTYYIIHESNALGEDGQVIYLENKEFFASIYVPKNNGEGKPTEFNYVLTLKSCGEELAYRLQTLPRK